jgi:hypothetical protein
MSNHNILFFYSLQIARKNNFRFPFFGITKVLLGYLISTSLNSGADDFFCVLPAARDVLAAKILSGIFDTSRYPYPLTVPLVA